MPLNQSRMMMRPYVSMVLNLALKWHVNCWPVMRYQDCIFTPWIERLPPKKFLQPYTCGVRTRQPADHCHGSHQQTRKGFARMWGPSSGRPGQRVTCTEHRTGMSFQMGDGGTLPHLPLVIWRIITCFTYEADRKRTTCLKCGARSLLEWMMCLKCSNVTFLEKTTSLVWR